MPFCQLSRGVCSISVHSHSRHLCVYYFLYTVMTRTPDCTPCDNLTRILAEEGFGEKAALICKKLEMWCVRDLYNKDVETVDFNSVAEECTLSKEACSRLRKLILSNVPYNPTTEMYEKFADYGLLHDETEVICHVLGLCGVSDLDDEKLAEDIQSAKWECELYPEAKLRPEAKKRLLKLVDEHIINEDEHLLRNMIAALAWWDDSSQQPWRT